MPRSASSPAVPLAARRAGRDGVSTTASTLDRREAATRSVATLCVAGIALIQSLGLRAVFAEGASFGVLSIAALAVCLLLGFALAAAPTSAARPLWRVVAGGAVVILVAWAIPHGFAVPGLADARGKWAAMPGAVCAGLAAVCLVAAVAARWPARPGARGLATAVALVVTFAPGVWALLVALGPGPVGGEQSLAAGHVHAHAHSTIAGEDAIEFRPGSGRTGGHYVVRAAPRTRQTAVGTGLLGVTAAMFTLAAIAHLGGRRAPRDPVARAGMQGGAA